MTATPKVRFTLASDPPADGGSYPFTGPTPSLRAKGTADAGTIQLAYQIDDGSVNPVLDVQLINPADPTQGFNWELPLTETDCPEPQTNYLFTIYQWSIDDTGSETVSTQVASFTRTD